MLARPITEMSVRNLVAITPSVEKRSDYRQCIYDEAGNVIETHEHTGDFREP
jgi:N-methylhydantoinase B/oxoprolinase/acetone carboxylase alpha subunit